LAEADWDELTRLGLYDPEAPNADDRRALLAHYVERGVGLDEMVAANEGGGLVTLLGDRTIRPQRDQTLAELSGRVGLAPDVAVAAIHAAGLPATADQRSFGEQDLDLLAGFALASELFGTEALLHFVRAMGMAASHLAAGASEVERSAANESAVVALQGIPAAFEIVFRHHVEHELRRSLLSATDPGSPTATLAIGFLDVVGFTTTSSTLTVDELAGTVAAFESLAGDVITAHGARLVKVIGDEVMFVTHEPEAACAVAEEVLAGADARGGITYGPVLTLDGDFYGNGVNLAARAVAAAEPGQVLVDRGVVDAVPGREFATTDPRRLKGFAEPVPLFRLT
jgi:class 3 adenylate cyclase